MSVRVCACVCPCVCVISLHGVEQRHFITHFLTVTGKCQTRRRTTEHHCRKTHLGRSEVQLLYVPTEITWVWRRDATCSRPPSKLVAGLGPDPGLGAQQKFIDETQPSGTAGLGSMNNHKL